MSLGGNNLHHVVRVISAWAQNLRFLVESLFYKLGAKRGTYVDINHTGKGLITNATKLLYGNLRHFQNMTHTHYKAGYLSLCGVLVSSFHPFNCDWNSSTHMDCHDILYTCSWYPEDKSLSICWSLDFSWGWYMLVQAEISQQLLDEWPWNLVNVSILN